MSDPLSKIPPLIPLPPSTAQSDPEGQIDKFASLFSPPTPHATPTGSPRPDRPVPPTKHVRQESDDFGSFVSVPSTQAPLVENTPGHRRGWSFFEEARARDNKKRESLLAEMDRPLFADTDPTPASSISLIDDTLEPTQNTESPKPSINPLANVPEQLERAVSSSPHSSPRPTPKRSPTLSMASRPPSLAPPLASTSSVSSMNRTSSTEDLTRSTSSLDLGGRHSRSYTDFTQSPSISKRRSSHSNSAPPPLTSYSTLSALSAKWMSSFLSTPAPTQSPATTSTEHHTSPFAPKQPYVPPSGAPGYTGEREGWDKDGRWYGALEKDLAKSSPSPSRPPIPSFVSSSSTPSRSNTPPVPRPMGTLLTTALPPLKLSGLMPTTSAIMTIDLASALRAHLPPLRRLRDNWQLLYSLDQHGVSLGTLYSRCDRIGSGMTQIKRVGEFASAKDEFGIMGSGGAVFGTSAGGITSTTGELGTVFVAQDSNGGVFGVWLGERLRAGVGGYFGSGESFLWRQLSPTDVEVFKWTGKNDYVALCENDYISFGGGDGSYGLYLDSSLYEGSSAPCPTFENTSLCDGNGEGMRKFECVGLEVWGV